MFKGPRLVTSPPMVTTEPQATTSAIAVWTFEDYVNGPTIGPQLNGKLQHIIIYEKNSK